MDSERIRKLLEQVRGGNLSVEDAFSQLKDLPYEDMGFARLDTHRAMRKGYPEVIFCPGKTIDQIVKIFERMARHDGRVMAARATVEAADAIKVKFPQAVYHESARIVTIGAPATPSGKGTVLVMSAGTADIPVADEAAVTAETLGSKVERLFDVGVAGIHRLLDRRENSLRGQRAGGRGRDGRRAPERRRRAGQPAGDRRADQHRVRRILRRHRGASDHVEFLRAGRDGGQHR